MDNLGDVYVKNKESASADQDREESLHEEVQVDKTQVGEDKKQTRQSQMIKEQGLEGIKIADKASLVVQKKNLEGKQLKLKNSFAVLSNNELIVRAGKMGVETSRIDMEKTELIKDLETARANMENGMEETQENTDMENMMPLPLVEMKYKEWKSDSSDEEGFKAVYKKRSRKKEGTQGLHLSKRPGVRGLTLLMRSLPLKEGVLDIVLSITSERGLRGIKPKHDRDHLEL
jgi:hypothetical protein